MTAAAFYVIKLQGSYGYFYCMYLATLCLGVGEWDGAHSVCMTAAVQTSNPHLGPNLWQQPHP